MLDILNIKDGIKMRVTEEQSKKVQEICFKLGIDWAYSLKGKVITGLHYLYIYNESIQYSYLRTDFEESMDKEVSAEEFIQTKGFTETEKAKPKEPKKDNKKDNKKDISKKILKKFIKRIKKEQKNKNYSEVIVYNKCADILKDTMLEVSKGNEGNNKKKVKGD